MAALAQELRHVLGGLDRERVDDARAGQLREPGREPAEPLGGRAQLHHRQAQALPIERAAQDERRRRITRRIRGARDIAALDARGRHACEHAAAGCSPPSRDARRAPPRCRAGCAVGRGTDAAHAQLLGDVDDHPVVRGGRGGEHRDARRQLADERPQPSVVGAEVVPPVGHAMRLVDDEHARARREPGEHPIAEIGVVEPLGADQQHVDLARVDRRVGALPLGGVGGVDRDRPDARPLRRLDLVAHQREQRRDDDRRPGACRAQQRGGHEVHRGLAPAGALHDERPPPLRHERVDRRPLVFPQARLRPGQRGEGGFGLPTQILFGRRHAAHGAPAVRQSGARTGIPGPTPAPGHRCEREGRRCRAPLRPKAPPSPPELSMLALVDLPTLGPGPLLLP